MRPVAVITAFSLFCKTEGAVALFSSSTIGGQVKDGFTISLGGNVALYGYTNDEGIPVLGASVGQNPDPAPRNVTLIGRLIFPRRPS